MAALLVGLDVAALATSQEVPLLSVPAVVLTWCIAWLVRRMSVQARGVKEAFSERLRNLRIVGEAVGIVALSIAVWAGCQLGGGGRATCIVVPAIVGAMAAWGVFVRRNQSLTPGAKGGHAR
ncbi:hypothetical protein ACFCX0_41570 [Streptomyces sp. NPDC056352]|uniref:hypothetical protein n=1 Tax=Streptomyces sp. NPDC056352 TaxID=3345791 RepID=UPI0035E3477A